MDTRPPSSPGPGGLLRQSCGWDVTRGLAGYRESLPLSERRNQTVQQGKRTCAMKVRVTVNVNHLSRV